MPNVFQIKITLKYTDPKIWRRIQVPGDYNFEQLHSAIQDAMGWDGMHPHKFEIFNPATRRVDTIYTPLGECPSMMFEELGFLLGDEHKIASYFLKPKDKAMYLYDFGDKWEHGILVEKIFPAVPGTEYPVCVGGEMACPPDDCGGVWGYQELLAITADPSHPEYEDRREWLGDDFDPREFDPTLIEFT